MENNRISWPGWETVKLIGRGSFGAVYEIQRDVLGDVEKAALKVISIPQNDGDIEEMYGEGYDDESITSTFQSHLKSIVAEYSLMRKMNGCTNIVNCDDIRYIQHDDGIGWDIFIKMELLTPLMKALPTDVPEDTVIKIGRDICAALELCREHDIVHRDIKPQNIFESSRGDYKLGDFGIAKTVEKTMGGTKIGTYKYMAPEVYNNQPYGTSADIYSLGLVLYWLLNEKRMPFLPLPPAKMSVGMEEAARQCRFSGEPLPAPKNGSERLKNIVLKACAFDPKERYQSATEMLKALNDLQEKQPVFAPIPAPAPTPAPVQQLVPQPEPVSEPQTKPAPDPEPETVLQSVPQPELVSVPRAETVLENKSVPAPTQISAPKLVEKSTSHINKHKKIGWWPILILIVLAVVIIVCMTRCNSGDERVITGISVSQLPEQQEYCVGETLNVDGLVIKVEYSDGTTEQVTSGFYCPTTKFSTTGRQRVVVSYYGHQVGFDVYVTEPAPTRISVHSMPTKTKYFAGETLDLSGFSLLLIYPDGSTKIAHSGYTCSPETLGEPGPHLITVTYEGLTTEFGVNVVTETDVPGKGDGVMTHAEYVQAEEGALVTVEMFIQAKMTWAENYQNANFYGQNLDGAYFLFRVPCSKEEYDQLMPGTKIRVTGYKTQYGGLIEIKDASFQILDGYWIAEALDVTALLGSDSLIEHMNKRVSFTGMTVEAYTENGEAFVYNWDGTGTVGDDLYFKASINGETYTFVVEHYLCGANTAVYEMVSSLQVGDVIDMEGFLHWFNGPEPNITWIAVKN